MKRKLFFAVAAMSAMASGSSFAAQFNLDFEKSWDYANGDVDGYYAGGTAADGSAGPDVGVSFVGVSGLSNDADFTYYSNAPSLQGVAYAHTFLPEDKALMNVAGGVEGGLSFFYASPSAAAGAIKAYSGLNGTGDLLGTIDLAANSSIAYDTWTQVGFSFGGTALSFDLGGSANLVALDDIKAVPVPPAALLLGTAMVGMVGLRRKTMRDHVVRR